jgi:hypothetical protein
MICFSDNDIKDDMAGSTAIIVILKDGKIFCVSLLYIRTVNNTLYRMLNIIH